MKNNIFLLNLISTFPTTPNLSKNFWQYSNKFRSACFFECTFLNPQSLGDKILFSKSSICWEKPFSNIFQARSKRLIGLKLVLSLWFSCLKTEAMSAIFI